MKSEKTLFPVHPGEILQCDFLEPMNLSQNKLSLEIKVSARRINEIVLGKRGITADTALRLSIFFGTTPELWLNLQNQYEIDTAKLKEEEELRQIIRPFKAA
ncbi:MAG: addiction module antidote protein, HigA family [Candidatus Moranbacteria bacterium]|nr:addiction module antidote protein, HigA family [Candidatus Moranbacteria bacterium]